eukprot:GEMP01058118.1.p1 GENE.GEMP01058118.1~~GEMP01058118.1.p1  ORF type:complete len:205 (+),score=32.21 GEMP01058118.1:216-830(+)
MGNLFGKPDPFIKRQAMYAKLICEMGRLFFVSKYCRVFLAHEPTKTSRGVDNALLWLCEYGDDPVQMSVDTSEDPKHRGLKERTSTRNGRFSSWKYAYQPKVIGGTKYDQGVILFCEIASKRSDGGAISRGDINYLLKIISPSYVMDYSQVKKNTMKYIRKKYEWSTQADNLLRDEMVKWNGWGAPVTKKGSEKSVKKAALKHK